MQRLELSFFALYDHLPLTSFSMLVLLSRAVVGRHVEHHYLFSGRHEIIKDRIYHPPFSSQSRTSGDLQINGNKRFLLNLSPKFLAKDLFLNSFAHY
jgi:hypothetical protein